MTGVATTVRTVRGNPVRPVVRRYDTRSCEAVGEIGTVQPVQRSTFDRSAGTSRSCVTA